MKKLALTLLVLASLPAQSAILPTPKPYDYRMTEVFYNPFNVTNVRASIGKLTVIQLDDDERVLGDKKGLFTGDASAWGFDIIDNSIFFKPTVINPDTNLMITTNKGRIYAFDLSLDDYPHYLVKFTYPIPPKKKEVSSVPTVPCMDGVVNYQYEKWGDDHLSPAYMWDDGRFTCLKFNDVFELPVIYQVLADGSESMIQYHMQNNTMVVHGTSQEFRLRIGDEVLGLHTKRAQTSSHNDKKTSIQAKRVIKHE